ncbi:MAG: hypothetical protein IK120_07685 [Muribaculaceae bacterium]|nr:hypothetical protein [Muribaculaceae bacterium]
MEYLKNRNRDLEACARRVIGEYRAAGRKIRLADIVRQSISSPAPHFYLTYDYAIREVRRYRRNPESFEGASMRKAQIREIVGHIDHIERASRGLLTDDDALTRVLASTKASRFFISEAYAVKIIRKLLFRKMRN